MNVNEQWNMQSHELLPHSACIGSNNQNKSTTKSKILTVNINGYQIDQETVDPLCCVSRVMGFLTVMKEIVKMSYLSYLSV